METYGQYRLLLQSSRTFDIATTAFMSDSFHMPIGMVVNREKPIIDIYSITEERYKIKDGYKVGLVGNANHFTPDENHYLGDLRSLLKNRASPLEGVYLAYEFGMDTKPKIMDLIVTTKMGGEHKLQQVWQVKKVRKGIMAALFGDFKLEEINGVETMNLTDFHNTESVKVEILKEASLSFLN